MHFTGLLAGLLCFSLAQAKLSCLGWSLLNPFHGVFCFLKPETFEAVTEAAGNKIHDAVNGTIFETAEKVVTGLIDEFTTSISNVLDFSVSHSPVNITYQLYKDRHNATQAVANLKSSLGDVASAGVGFGKETVNQGVGFVNLMSVGDWQDLSTCLIVRGASRAYLAGQTSYGITRVSSSNGTSRNPGSSLNSRAVTQLTSDDAVKVGEACFNDKFKQLAAPAVFNITDPNEQVGATLSDIAMLFVPFEEILAGGNAAKAGFSLVLAGEEDATKLLKFVSEDSAAAYFETREEALAVREQMKDKTWFKGNCGTCPLPGVGLKPRDVRRLQRRGGSLTTPCCKLPPPGQVQIHPEDDYSYSMLGPPPESESEYGDAVSQIRSEYRDPFEYGQYLSESELVPAPSFRTWGLDEAGVSEGLRKDIYELNSAIVQGPIDSKVLTIDEALAKFRKGLSAEAEWDDPLYRALSPRLHTGDKEFGGEEYFRKVATTDGRGFMKNNDPQIKDLQEFSKNMMEHAKKVMREAKPHLSAEELSEFEYSIEYHYTPPVEEAKLGIDPRGPHQDRTTAAMIAADRPGLVVSNAEETIEKGFSRSPNKPGTLHFIRGLAWDLSEDKATRGVVGGTTHTVFGDAIAKEGRLSMIVSVFKESEFRKLAGGGVSRYISLFD